MVAAPGDKFPCRLLIQLFANKWSELLVNVVQELIQNCDLALRAGKVSDAAKLMRTLAPSKVPREYRLPLARICRRCDQATLGLKLLTPVVYPEKNGLDEPATGPERAEFAALRMKIGSVSEALAILSRIDGSNVLEAPLLRAFCHMARWDYLPASQELKNYLSLQPETYPALVARVNLAASLISIYEMSEATTLLENLIHETKASGYDRLRANCYELRSQIYLETREDRKCLADLDSASEILTSQKTADQLYIQKWRAVLEARNANSTEPLLKLKKEALARQSWETVREMDFQTLKLKFDPALFQHLLWGTPYQAYRQRVCNNLGQNLLEAQSEHYVFGEISSSQVIVDLQKAEVTSGSLNPGKQVHRLLATLLQDFYRPISVGALYADLFPGEYYNVFSSPNRVHQALRRGRRWFESNDVPVSIEELNGQFALRSAGPVAFILGRDLKSADQKTAVLERLRAALLKESSFSSASVGHVAGLSSTSTVRFLNWALETRNLEKVGVGRATRYSFPKKQIPAAA
jgi:hypothetical protein